MDALRAAFTEATSVKKKQVPDAMSSVLVGSTSTPYIHDGHRTKKGILIMGTGYINHIKPYKTPIRLMSQSIPTWPTVATKGRILETLTLARRILEAESSLKCLGQIAHCLQSY